MTTTSDCYVPWECSGSSIWYSMNAQTISEILAVQTQAQTPACTLVLYHSQYHSAYGIRPSSTAGLQGFA